MPEQAETGEPYLTNNNSSVWAGRLRFCSTPMRRWLDLLVFPKPLGLALSGPKIRAGG